MKENTEWSHGLEQALILPGESIIVVTLRHVPNRPGEDASPGRLRICRCTAKPSRGPHHRPKLSISGRVGDLDTAPRRRGGWSDHPGGYRATDRRGRPPCRDAGHGEEPRPGQEGAGESEVSCRFLRTAGNAELPNRSFPEFSTECFQTAIDCVYVKPPKAEPLGRGGRGGGSCGPLGRQAWSRQISTREGARLDSRPTPYAKTSSKHSHDLRVRAKTIKPLEKKKR